MTRIGLLLVACTFVWVGCGFDDVVTGSGDRVTRTFDLDDATEIDVSDAFRVRVVVDPAGAQSVILEIDDNLADRVDIGVRDGRLRIGLEDSLTIRVDDSPTVDVVVAQLARVGVSGASNVTVDGVAVERFAATASGASSIVLRGRVADSIALDASGASRIDAADLSAVTADLNASGASRILALVTDAARANATGASTVLVSGDADLDATTSGASTVSRN